MLLSVIARSGNLHYNVPADGFLTAAPGFLCALHRTPLRFRSPSEILEKFWIKPY